MDNQHRVSPTPSYSISKRTAIIIDVPSSTSGFSSLRIYILLFISFFSFLIMIWFFSEETNNNKKREEMD